MQFDWDVAMWRGSVKFVTLLLTTDQKQLRVKVSQGMLNGPNGNDILSTVVTGDKSLVPRYNPEANVQSSQINHLLSLRSNMIQKEGAYRSLKRLDLWSMKKVQLQHENEKSPSSTWELIRPFLAHNSDFRGQTQNSCASQNSMFFRHGSLPLLAVPQADEYD